jgi:hypothetical protein
MGCKMYKLFNLKCYVKMETKEYFENNETGVDFYIQIAMI